MAFKDLALIEPILKALNVEGYTEPTPIQKQAIPIVLQGRDLLGCAQTGTGKTAAFAIPILQLLTEQKNKTAGIKTLILTPTRELAIQINESFAAYGKFLNLKNAVVFGGVSQHSQVQEIKRGVDILIATPGRLLDLMNQNIVSLRSLEIFILDEADRMLDMGFIHDVKRIISKLPAQRQTLFFSATMPPEIQKLSDSLLKNPMRVEVTPPSTTVDKIDQSLYFTNKADKPKLLKHLLEDKKIETALVFTRTKHGANKVVKYLLTEDINAAAIHGNKSQAARQKALGDFKNGSLRVLVATDIAARGIDIDELSYVFNFDLPDVPETYVHRIGRTGRAGNSGKAIAFCDIEEKSELKDVEKLIRKTIPVVDDHPFPMVAGNPSSNSQPKPAARQGQGQGQRPKSSGQRPQRTFNRNFKRKAQTN